MKNQFTTTLSGPISLGGACLQGYLNIEYSNLISTFGNPTLRGHGKVDWEWIIKFSNGCIATIYNWKNGPGYGVDVGPEEIYEWNVGGFSNQALENVKAALLIDGKLS
jgi:hypothetical protein|tara:strand:+ start:293 stop:616 length:324 start_codon:yes stop_codon:yes gene_type:complete